MSCGSSQLESQNRATVGGSRWLRHTECAYYFRGCAAFTLHAVRQTLASSATLQNQPLGVSPRFTSETDA